MVPIKQFLLTQEHCKLIIFAFTPTLFKPSSSNVLQGALLLILGFEEYHEKAS